MGGHSRGMVLSFGRHGNAGTRGDPDRSDRYSGVVQANAGARRVIPLWLKLACTFAAVGILLVYWLRYGSQNYLWFSDIALILTIPALWLESSLLASTMAVGVLLPEAFWNLSLFSRLALGLRLTGLTDYMFEAERPAYLKALSLFHIPLPILLAWLVWTLGYDPRAPLLMTAIAWLVLPLTYAVTEPDRNINWVQGPGGEGARQQRFPPRVYVGLLMLAFPLAVYLPTHLLLMMIFGSS